MRFSGCKNPSGVDIPHKGYCDRCDDCNFPAHQVKPGDSISGVDRVTNTKWEVQRCHEQREALGAGDHFYIFEVIKRENADGTKPKRKYKTGIQCLPWRRLRIRKD